MDSLETKRHRANQSTNVQFTNQRSSRCTNTPTDSLQTKPPPDVPTHQRTVHRPNVLQMYQPTIGLSTNVLQRNQSTNGQSTDQTSPKGTHPPTHTHQTWPKEGSLTFCFFDLTLAGMTVEPVCSMAASELKTRVDSVDRLSPIREGRPEEQNTTTLRQAIHRGFPPTNRMDPLSTLSTTRLPLPPAP